MRPASQITCNEHTKRESVRHGERNKMNKVAHTLSEKQQNKQRLKKNEREKFKKQVLSESKEEKN